MKSNSNSPVGRSMDRPKRISDLCTLARLPLGRAALLWGCLLLVVGCGPQHPATYPVTGNVQFDDGEPVAIGLVEFRSRTKPALNARGKIEADGRFTLGTYAADDGAVLGDHDVSIVQVLASPLPTGGTVKHERDHGAAIDTKFGDYASSGLSVTVRSDGPNSPTLVVTKAKQQPERHHSPVPDNKADGASG